MLWKPPLGPLHLLLCYKIPLDPLDNTFASPISAYHAVWRLIYEIPPQPNYGWMGTQRWEERCWKASTGRPRFSPPVLWGDESLSGVSSSKRGGSPRDNHCAASPAHLAQDRCCGTSLFKATWDWKTYHCVWAAPLHYMLLSSGLE